MELALVDVKWYLQVWFQDLTSHFGNTYIRAKQMLYKLWKTLFFFISLSSASLFNIQVALLLSVSLGIEGLLNKCLAAGTVS